MRRRGRLERALQGVTALLGAGILTLAVFLVLPLMQVIGDPTDDDTLLREVDVAQLPPPPPPPAEQEPEKEEEPPEPPPQLAEEAPPLDLGQLELALDPGMGQGMLGDFRVDLLERVADESEVAEEFFSLAELDRRPRVVFQRAPRYPPDLLRQGRKGTVHVIFRIDASGRVVDAKVDSATDPAFERPALEAVRQWRFEPGTRKGEKVPFTLRIPITFNAG